MIRNLPRSVQDQVSFEGRALSKLGLALKDKDLPAASRVAAQCVITSAVLGFEGQGWGPDKGNNFKLEIARDGRGRARLAPDAGRETPGQIPVDNCDYGRTTGREGRRSGS